MERQYLNIKMVSKTGCFVLIDVTYVVPLAIVLMRDMILLWLLQAA